MPPKEALPKAKAAAIKAVQLDDTLGEAHNSLAFCLDGFDWDFECAGNEFRRAIELTPSYATAHHWYAWQLSVLGRNSEAIAEMQKARNLDPLSLIINADLAELFLIAHSYGESIQQSRRTIEMDPNFALAHNQLAQAYIQKHMFNDAIKELQKSIQVSGGSPIFTANLARAYAATGKINEATQLLDDLKKQSTPNYSHASEIATVYVALGDNDRALTWLEKGFEERFNRVFSCVPDSILSALIRDSRIYCDVLVFDNSPSGFDGHPLLCKRISTCARLVSWSIVSVRQRCLSNSVFRILSSLSGSTAAAVKRRPSHICLREIAFVFGACARVYRLNQLRSRAIRMHRQLGYMGHVFVCCRMPLGAELLICR